MVSSGKASKSPIAHYQHLNAALDRRRERKTSTSEELSKLQKAAKKGDKVLEMTGLDRAMLYHLAVETGLRWSELCSLTPSNFSLETDPPTVRFEAGYSKHRCEDVLPLRPNTAAELSTYLAGKMPKARAFPLQRYRGAEMLRKDLEAAKIDYIDESNRFVDFHSLRHTFITALARSGVHPKTAQSLARHSTITLTMDNYSHTVLEDQTEAISRLPDLTSNGESEEQKATGTIDTSGQKSEASSGASQGLSSAKKSDKLRQKKEEEKPVPHKRSRHKKSAADQLEQQRF